jgi:hypothetical protein
VWRKRKRGEERREERREKGREERLDKRQSREHVSKGERERERDECDCVCVCVKRERGGTERREMTSKRHPSHAYKHTSALSLIFTKLTLTFNTAKTRQGERETECVCERERGKESRQKD